MTEDAKAAGSAGKPAKEFEFVPRIMNPAKITNAVVLSADEGVRDAAKVLREKMPWVRVHVMAGPTAVAGYKSDEPSVVMLDDTAMNIVDSRRIRENNRDAVLVLLSSNPFIQCSPPVSAGETFPYSSKADLVFAVNTREFPPREIIASVLRSAEDLLNIEKYSRARRFIFLLVDDEPRWFSQFLPVLYDIIGQRADVMITRTYEDTLKFLFGVEDEAQINGDKYRSMGHGDDVVCLITDIFFPKGGDPNSHAGIDLIKLTRQYYPRYPVIIASKAKEANDFSDMAFVLPKGDPGSLEKLREYILNFTGLGAFVLCDKGDREVYRIRNIHEMYELLVEAEKETEEAERLRELLEIYGLKDHFSTWLYMHSYRELGDLLRPKRSGGRRLGRMLRRYLKREILRVNCTPLVVGGHKIYTLGDLLNVIRTVDSGKIQWLSDNDIFSSWLDRKGFPELAEELRPIHGDVTGVRESLVHCVDRWIRIYEERNQDSS